MHFRRSKYIALVIGLFGLVSYGCSRIAERPLTVSMKISKLNTNDCNITVTVINTCDMPMTFKGNDLPWNISSDNMTLALVQEDHSRKDPIKRTPIITDLP